MTIRARRAESAVISILLFYGAFTLLLLDLNKALEFKIRDLPRFPRGDWIILCGYVSYAARGKLAFRAFPRAFQLCGPRFLLCKKGAIIKEMDRRTSTDKQHVSQGGC
jgi:hypothetical protein